MHAWLTPPHPSHHLYAHPWGARPTCQLNVVVTPSSATPGVPAFMAISIDMPTVMEVSSSNVHESSRVSVIVMDDSRSCTLCSACTAQRMQSVVGTGEVLRCWGRTGVGLRLCHGAATASLPTKMHPNPCLDKHPIWVATGASAQVHPAARAAPHYHNGLHTMLHKANTVPKDMHAHACKSCRHACKCMQACLQVHELTLVGLGHGLRRRRLG